MSLNHLAIIMDGNGRWAQQRLRPRTFGHIKGARVAKQIITECSRQKIKFLTLYAFSTENWLRPEDEVSFLMTLLHRYLKKETDNLVKENIRFHVIGDIKRLPKNIQEAIQVAFDKTKNCTGLTVQFALNYGSRQELTMAIQKLVHAHQSGEISLDEINEKNLEKYLYTNGSPDPDLIIRTSGEQRLSNFLLWQSAYSELYFSDVLWPDFKVSDLNQALNSFGNRNRRFGRVDHKVNNTQPTPSSDTSL